MEANDILPSEIWMLIFGYITEFKDIYCISRTCKLFNQIVFESIKSIESNIRLDMRYIQKFPSLTRVLTHIQGAEIHLKYFTEHQFKEIHITIDNIIRKECITEYLLEFLKNNPQIDNLSIYFQIFIVLKLRHKELYILDINPSVIKKLNELTHPHINIITLFNFNSSINNLNFSKYKILINSHNCNEEWFEIVKVPMRFKISCNMSRFRNPHLLPHRIFNYYCEGNIEDFEIQLDNLRYNFPNAKLDIVYCRSVYLKSCVNKFRNNYDNSNEYLFLSPKVIQERKLDKIREKEKYNEELKRDISEKKYKII